MTCLNTFPRLYDSVNVKKEKSESVVDLHTPRSNEGHQGKTDGENNPEPHVWMMMTRSNKETDSRSPAVLKISMSSLFGGFIEASCSQHYIYNQC